MGFTATAGNGSNFRRVPSGVHIARCTSVIDLGTQSVVFKDETKQQHKIQVSWEVLGEDEAGVPLTVERDGKEMPLVISKRYTLSLHEKAGLRRDLEAWRGKPFSGDELKGFDISKLLGTYCMLNVLEQDGDGGKVYSNIQSITPLPRGVPKPAGVHPLIAFDIDNPDMQVFGGFHDKLQEVIQQSAEWKARATKPASKPAAAAPAPALEEMADDVPW